MKAKDLRHNAEYLYTGGAENRPVTYLGAGRGGHLFSYTAVRGSGMMELGPYEVMSFIRPYDEEVTA